MGNLSGIVIVKPQRRAAVVTIKYDMPGYGLTKGTHKAYVVACLQDGDTPVFVCEFKGGIVHNVYTEAIKFVNEGEIECYL